MLLWVFKMIRSVRAAFLGKDTARQLAWGIALGVVLGLVPKGNLLAPTIAIILLCININHTLAIVTAGLLTFFGGRLDPLSHAVGQMLLEEPAIRQTVTKLHQLPVMPWMSLNNTVVLGGLVIGLAMVTPTYLVTSRLLRRYRKEANVSQPAKSKPSPTPVSTAQLRFDPPQTMVLETHIDVVRLKRMPEVTDSSKSVKKKETIASPSNDANEALRYLVRHVRESSEEKAA